VTNKMSDELLGAFQLSVGYIVDKQIVSMDIPTGGGLRVCGQTKRDGEVHGGGDAQQVSRDKHHPEI
jgi:hypothetical protein